MVNASMNMQTEFTAYLTRMLGRSVDVDQTLTLTSGQQARAAGWLAERGFAPSQLRKELSAPFTAAGLLSGGCAQVSPPSSVGKRSGSEPRARLQRHATQTLAVHEVGIDIQRVDEVIPGDGLSDLKSSGEITATFSLREISYAQSRPSPRETLCGLFCAKEALRKCDAALLALPLTGIEILPDEEGRPCFHGYALSISHSGGFAVAVALRTATATQSAPSAFREPQPAPAPSAQIDGAVEPRARRAPQPRVGALLDDVWRRLFPKKRRITT